MQVFVLGVGSPDGSPIPAEDGSNNFRRDKDGNVIVTRLNEQMCQEIAKAGAYPAGGRNAYFGTEKSAFQKCQTI